MPQFQASARKVEKVTVSRNQVFWIIEFAIDQPELDNLPASLRAWIDGELLYGFYAGVRPRPPSILTR